MLARSIVKFQEIRIQVMHVDGSHENITPIGAASQWHRPQPDRSLSREDRAAGPRIPGPAAPDFAPPIRSQDLGLASPAAAALGFATGAGAAGRDDREALDFLAVTGRLAWYSRRPASGSM